MALNIYKSYVAQDQQQASRSTATFVPHTVCPLVLLPTSTCLPLISFTPTLIFLPCRASLLTGVERADKLLARRGFASGVELVGSCAFEPGESGVRPLPGIPLENSVGSRRDIADAFLRGWTSARGRSSSVSLSSFRLTSLSLISSDSEGAVPVQPR
jgi:hypothetical protein